MLTFWPKIFGFGLSSQEKREREKGTHHDQDRRFTEGHASHRYRSRTTASPSPSAIPFSITADIIAAVALAYLDTYKSQSASRRNDHF